MICSMRYRKFHQKTLLFTTSYLPKKREEIPDVQNIAVTSARGGGLAGINLFAPKIPREPVPYARQLMPIITP